MDGWKQTDQDESRVLSECNVVMEVVMVNMVMVLKKVVVVIMEVEVMVM